MGVWVEMLLYAAEHCSRDAHVRNLTDNNGGEFITILWLVFRYHQKPIGYNTGDLLFYKEEEEKGELLGEEELRQYDGSDPDKPLLMAIKGNIYDVTENRMLYGPGGRNSLYAGKDASRTIAKNSFEPENLTRDISGHLSEEDTLKRWEDFFMKNYIKVGLLLKSMTLEELKQYDGSDPTKPVFMAIKGNIYDVTEHRWLFGPDGPCRFCAGRDASRAIAQGPLNLLYDSDPEEIFEEYCDIAFMPEELSGDLSGLEPSQLRELEKQEEIFKSRYTRVATIKKSFPLQREETKARPPSFFEISLS